MFSSDTSNVAGQAVETLECQGCERVQLVETATMDTRERANCRYTTLSYVWGGDQKVRLDASSEKALLMALKASSCPRTLEDAMKLTLRLGLQYIWIDCLCIHQDDPKEIALEIGRLHSIFGGSYLTISAARARHADQGFLHEASQPPVSEVSCMLPFACPNGKRGSIILSDVTLDPAPIEDRAWTLPEYLLSRRTIQFTDFKFHWTCREDSIFDNEDAALLPGTYWNGQDGSFAMLTGLRGVDLDSNRWMSLVEAYTNRKLTHYLDKLPAISGIAECWASKSRDFYLAGLWASHLPTALLWTAGNSDLETSNAEYRAPSWSWASLDRSMEWFGQQHQAVCPELTIVTYTVTPTLEEAPYGTVTSGSLSLRGKVQATCLPDPYRPGSCIDPPNGDGLLVDLSLAGIWLDSHDAVLASKIRGSRMYGLQICCFDESTRKGPSGLLLVTRDDQNFRRIGVFMFDSLQKDDMDQCEDFDELMERSKAVLMAQRTAFLDVVPRLINLI